MREVEVGLIKCKPILWVDDKNLNSDWENKSIMENAQKNIDQNIRFILKTNTDLAVSFLKSCFGKRIQKNQNFRIISDMHRENENDSSYAGCNLMREIN